MSQRPGPAEEDSRVRLVEALNARLADGLDLWTQVKVAHWNAKGPHFASLRPLFETFALSLANCNDAVAERAATLSGVAHGTARHVASLPRLLEYPGDTWCGPEHVRRLADRFEVFLAGLRESRALGETSGDRATVEIISGVIQAFEKNAWFLRPSRSRRTSSLTTASSPHHEEERAGAGDLLDGVV